MTLTSDGGYNFIGNGSSFTGTISVTGPEVFTLQRNLAGSVSIGSDTGFSIGMDNVSLDGALTLKDNSWYVVAANASGGAATLTAGGLNIGSGVRVAIGRTNPADYIWTNELKQGSYTIIETTDPINGKFEDGVYTEAGGFSDVNIGSPLVDASLDQQETKIVLNVSIKEEDVVLPGISSESNSLINAIKNGATPDSPLMSLVLGSTPSELQTFGKEMDTARGSISAASSMAVNTAAPASMARLDSLNSGGTTPGTALGAFSPLNSFTSSMSLSASGFAELEQYRAVPRTISPYAQMMAQAVGSSGVVNGVWARPVYWHTHNESEGSSPASSIDGLRLQWLAMICLSGPAMHRCFLCVFPCIAGYDRS